MTGELRGLGLARHLVRRLPTVVAVAALLVVWIGLNLQGSYFRDAMAYWRPDLNDLYEGREVGVMSTYLYSPAFAQLASPLGLLPWEAFALVWSAANLALLAWMVGPVVAALLVWIPGPVADEVSTGNIHLLLAAMVVIGFRHPAFWSFALLSKVTPGVGLIWFVGARQWRPSSIALATTALVVVLSVMLAPDAWVEWVDTLRRSATVPAGEAAVIPGPLWLRTAVAALLALAGGMLSVKWLVPIAAFVALPVPWASGLSLLVGSLALTRVWWERAARLGWHRVTRRGARPAERAPSEGDARG